MMSIQMEKLARKRIALIGFVVLAIVSTLMIVIRNQASSTDALIYQPDTGRVTLASDRDAVTLMSASEALATNKPVLFVFTPAEQCAIQYCLTAEIVQKKVIARFSDDVSVVEVPVYGFHIYTDGTPPDYLNADWDLYPTEPYLDWLPKATLTQFGWGLSDTKLVLINEEAQLAHIFGGSLDLEVLEEVLD